MKDREPGPPQEKLASLPSSPGVYLFVDGEGDVIYVGKAKQLRRRVRSYFTRSGGGDGRTFFPNIVEETEDLECIVTDNEKEALILENILIKKHRPRYNLVFRDDKSYLKLRLTVRDPFPRLHPVRKVRRDGARYFGPFSSASALRETLALLQTRFPLRNCTDSQFANRSRPCIRHEIRQCSAPCCDRVSRDTYGSMVREAVLFLEGKIPQLVKTLRDRMNREADALRFEEAARLRDASEAVEKTLTEQKVVSYDLQDRDVFGLYREGGDMALAVLFVREGNVVGSTGASYQGFPTDEEALSASIMQFYAAENPPPPTVLVPVELPDAELLAEVLAERRGGAVHLTTPKRGQKRALIAMAGKNASLVLAHSDRSLQRRARAIEDLKEQVGLPRTPHRIECFDVSHITGSWAVGAQVVFQDGAPEPKSSP
jgi:excinuclease ABC subunit C